MLRQPVVHLSIFVGISLTTAAFANPSQKTPQEPLDVHNLTQAQTQLNEAKALLDECTKTIPSMKQPTVKMLSQEHVNLKRLHRLALELQIHGEPAGYDLELRAKHLDRLLKTTVDAFKVSKAGPTSAASARQMLAQPRNAQGRGQALERIKQFIKAQKWIEAGAVLDEATDNITSLTMFLEPEEEKRTLDVFYDVWLVIGRRNAALRQQTQAALGQLAGGPLLDLAGVHSEVSQAAATLRSAPTVRIGDAALTGPQCLEHFGKLWGQAQLAALRYRAIEWARRVPVADVAVAPVQDPMRIDDKAYARLCDDLIKALASLIEADAARAAGPEATKLYGEYLPVAAPIAAAAADDKLRAALAAALEPLAAKAPELAAEVAAYRAATDECLRWRQRAAESAAAARLASYTPSERLVKQAVVSKPGFAGLLDHPDRPLEQTQLLAHCPAVLAGMAPQLLEQRTLLQNVAGLTVANRAVARYQNRHYSNLPAPAIADALRALEHDLLVTEQRPPLTLDAATAIASAQRGNYVAVGAVVKNVYLEGVIPRFAKLTEAAAPLVALGPLPTELAVGIESVLVRLDVNPDWARHKYFFVDIASNVVPSPPAANSPIGPPGTSAPK